MASTTTTTPRGNRTHNNKLLISRSRLFMILLAVACLLLQFQWLQKTRVASEEVHERATTVLEGYTTTTTKKKKRSSRPSNSSRGIISKNFENITNTLIVGKQQRQQRIAEGIKSKKKQRQQEQKQKSPKIKNNDPIPEIPIPPIHDNVKPKQPAPIVHTRDEQLAGIDDYMTDPLCGGCRWHYDHRTKKTCGRTIAMRAKNDKIPLDQAARLEIDAGSKDCQKCVQCDSHLKRYWRPDRTRPTITNAVTHYLQSIPTNFRVPKTRSLLSNDTALADFFRKYPASPTSGRQYLFEYNPAIVQYPTHVNTQQQPLLQIDGEVPAYIASYRVSNQQACFPTAVTEQLIGGDWKQRPDGISFLGMALLRKDLSIMVDGVFDPPARFGSRDDFRLFFLPEYTTDQSNTNLQLYLTTGRRLLPLWIGTTEQPPVIVDPKMAMEMPPRFPQQRVKLNMGQFQLKASEDTDAQGNNHATVGSAKNFNYFIDKEGTTRVEFNPPGNSLSQYRPHEVQPVHLNIKECAGNKGKPTTARYNYFNDSIATKEIPIHQSFYTMDELELAYGHEHYETPYTPDRGGACCLEIHHPNDNTQKLLVGISHVKVPWQRRKILKQLDTEPNQYLSRFYAFEPTSPFKTVAFSGYFCFNSPLDRIADPNDLQHHPLAHRPPPQLFKMSKLTLDCPHIHFISGMTVKVGDPSKVIIAYGLQDCTSWFVEVDKQEIIDLLFQGPKQQRSSTSSSGTVQEEAQR